MIKHPPADDNEATLAAMAYLPGVMPLLYLTMEPGKRHYFLRYHLAHSLMLQVLSFLALGAAALLGYLPQAPEAAYLLMGVAMSLVILGTTIVHLVAAIQAYRKRLVVFPLLTPLFYRFFDRT